MNHWRMHGYHAQVCVYRDISLWGLTAITVPAASDVTIDCGGARIFTHGSNGPLVVAPSGTLRFAHCHVDTNPSIKHGRVLTSAALQAFGPAANITVQMRNCEARMRNSV